MIRRRPSGWCRRGLSHWSGGVRKVAHQDIKSLGDYSGGQVYDLAQQREGLPCKETNQCETLSDYLEPLDLTLKCEAEFHPYIDRKTRHRQTAAELIHNDEDSRDGDFNYSL